MATSKTLAPTNVTISIPAMTDQPDASVFSNCVDKEADAINALNSQIANKIGSTIIGTISSVNSATQKFNIPSSTRTLLILKSSYNESYDAVIFIYSTTSGGIISTPIYVGSNVTINTGTNNEVTFTLSTARSCAGYYITFSGDAPSRPS